MKNKKIIIIDSGIGGLSILKKIISIKINYIYIMDNYGFPYGNKNYIYIANRIYKILLFLSKKYNIIFTIIACNTASITILNYIKKKFNFPIFGILPNIKKAIKKTKNNLILLLGTYITINSNYINNIIKKISNKIKIIKLYSSKLVNYAEKKIKYNFKIKNKYIKNIIIKKNKKKINPDTLIIGCTHFSFLKKEFKNIFNKNIYIIEYINKIKKKIYKYIKLLNNKKKKIKIKKKNYFLYTKKQKFNNKFIKKIKNIYKINILKKIKI